MKTEGEKCEVTAECKSYKKRRKTEKKGGWEERDKR